LTSRWRQGSTFAEFSQETTRQYYGVQGRQSRREQTWDQLLGGKNWDFWGTWTWAEKQLPMPFSLVRQKLQAVLVWFKKSTPNAPKALAYQGAARAFTDQFNAMYVDDTDGLVWFLQSDGSTGPVSKVIGCFQLSNTWDPWLASGTWKPQLWGFLYRRG